MRVRALDPDPVPDAMSGRKLEACGYNCPPTHQRALSTCFVAASTSACPSVSSHSPFALRRTRPTKRKLEACGSNCPRLCSGKHPCLPSCVAGEHNHLVPLTEICHNEIAALNHCIMTLSQGDRLGRYEILGPIGAGGMGEVWRALDTELDRQVAVKVLPESFASDENRLERFQREAKALAALSHPNLLDIYDVGATDGIHFAVTELLEGDTLRERITPSGLPWKRVTSIGAAVADGLAAAHGRGIIHRDIKPENLFITADGRVKILDFGLASVHEDAAPDARTATITEAGTVMGTPGYMAPEQVKGQPADTRSDIFSLGCVIYEMASGHRAFGGDTGAEVIANILKEEPPQLSSSGASVPVDLERAVHRCLEKRPEARFQSAADLAYSLKSVGHSGTAPVMATPGSGSRGTGREEVLSGADRYRRRPRHPRRHHLVVGADPARWRTGPGRDCHDSRPQPHRGGALHQPHRRRLRSTTSPPSPPTGWSRAWPSSRSSMSRRPAWSRRPAPGSSRQSWCAKWRGKPTRARLDRRVGLGGRRPRAAGHPRGRAGRTVVCAFDPIPATRDAPQDAIATLRDWTLMAVQDHLHPCPRLRGRTIDFPKYEAYQEYRTWFQTMGSGRWRRAARDRSHIPSNRASSVRLMRTWSAGDPDAKEMLKPFAEDPGLTVRQTRDRRWARCHPRQQLERLPCRSSSGSKTAGTTTGSSRWPCCSAHSTPTGPARGRNYTNTLGPPPFGIDLRLGGHQTAGRGTPITCSAATRTSLP